MLTEEQLDAIIDKNNLLSDVEKPTTAQPGLRGGALFESLKTPVETPIKEPAGVDDRIDIDEKESKIIPLFEKYLVNPTEKTAEFLFSNFAQAAGAPIVDLATGFKTNEMARVGSEPTTLFFAALEVFPGGGAIVQSLKRVPGLSKIINLLGKVKGKTAGVLKEKAVTMMTQALKPTTKEMKDQTARIVNEALEKGIRGTQTGIQEQAETSARRVWTNLDEALKAVPEDTIVKTEPIVKELAELQKKYVVDGVVVNKTAHEAINEAGDLIMEFGDEVSFKSLRKVKQILDSMTYGAKKVFGKTLTETSQVKFKKALADTIREELAKTNPNIAKINKEYSFWKTLDNIMTTTIERTKPQTGLIDTTAQVVGAAVGLRSGGVVKAIITGAAFKEISRFMRSTYWKSVSAHQRNRVANLIATGKIEEAAYVLGRLYDGLKSKDNK